MTQTNQRHIPLPGTHNLRDLGGYPTADSMTQWCTFYRSDSLHNLAEEAKQQLLSMGIRTIIDLRHASEIEEAPNVFERGNGGVRYLNIPLFEELFTRSNHVKVTPPEHLLQIYQMAVDHCQEAIGQVFQALAEEDQTPILFHCTAGKDRTGIIAGILLSTVGVQAEVIAEDYGLTSRYAGPIFERLRIGAREKGQDSERFERMLLAEPQTMLDLLMYMEEKYGGPDDYLLEIGLTNQQIQQLRQKLLQPPSRE